MNSPELRAKLSRLRHPSEEDLFLLLDGGLGTGRTRRVQRHLRSCWSCRVQVEEMSRGIAKAVQLRNELSEALPGRWDMAELDRQVAGLLCEEPGAKKKRFPGWFGRLPVQAAMAATALSILLWLKLSSPDPVSAHQLYQRAEAAESQRTSPVTQPVVYQKIRVRRRAAGSQETGTVETWTAIERARREHRGGDGIWREVEDLLERNRLNAERPLSTSSYRQWADALPAKQQVVETRGLADGSPAWVIRTTLPAAGPRPYVEQAELVLRQADLHPVQESLHVLAEGGDREYELTEMAFTVLPAAALDPAIFPEVPLPDRQTIRAKPPAPAAPVALPRSLPVPRESAAELTVQAFYVLHQMRRCMDASFEVVRSGYTATVRGLVDTQEEKELLLAALGKFPGLRLDVQTFAEAREKTVRPSESKIVVAEARRGEDYLRALVGESVVPARLTEISNRVVTSSNAWLLHAWALHRLAATFSAEFVQDLGPVSAGLLEKIVRDHAAGMRQDASAFLSEVRPLFPTPAVPPGTEDPVSWPVAVTGLFEAANESQRLAQILFTGEGRLTEPADEALRRLLISVSAVETRSRDLEIRAAEIFQGSTTAFHQRSGESHEQQ
jgi:hypothetical protein